MTEATEPQTESAIINELESKVALLEERLARQDDVIRSFKRKSQDLKHRLSVDHRSGLPNHHRLSWYFPERVNEARERGETLFVMILRLDAKFSMLARTMKQSVVNWLLYQTGERLVEAVGGDATVYHTREDEFVIVGRRPEPREELKRTVALVIDTVGRQHRFSGYRIRLGCHAGVAFWPDHGNDRHRLMHAADLALESAVARGRRVVLFDDSIRREVVEKMELQSAILKALESQAMIEISRQFEVYLQPIVTVAEGGKGEPVVASCDAEALIRWNHPTRGLIGPDSFIPTAEETGLIVPIGNWVLYKTVELLESWKDGALGNVRVSVNISPRQFNDDQLVEIIRRLLRTKPWLRGRLRLEITESCLMEDPRRSVERIGGLKAEGASFSVDDFGTGYSSLSYLAKLPVSSVKIDRSFTKRAAVSRHDLAVVRAVMGIGRELELEVIGEGVETGAELDLLLREGCTRIQGYFFSCPVPAAAFERWALAARGRPVASFPPQACPD